MDKVRDWMTQPAICIAESLVLPEARRLMRERRVRRLLVLGEDQRLVGIVTEGDINRISDSHIHDVREYNLYHRAADLPVRDFMTRDVVSVAPDDSVITVAQILLRHRIGGVPVVDAGQVVGVITESDLFRRMVARQDASD